jgi:subtilisin family serine protease
VVAAGVAVALVASVSAGGSSPAVRTTSAGSWLGLAGGPRGEVSLAERMIVVLQVPSVAERLAKVRYATEGQERGWWAEANAAQKQVILKLAGRGINVTPDFTYHEVIDGFSAVLDPRAVSALEQMPEVRGVFPVRAAYPASVSGSTLATSAFADASGRRPEAGLPGYNGRGVTIALLDTGVDLTHRYLRGRVLPGFDLVGGSDSAAARPDPQDPGRVEQHGTELAGILVGRGGPGGLHGVATAATVLPIRVAGWQAGSDGRDLVYARSDQLIAGLERAVDPNGDGDAHDAARIALVGVAEPYGAFADGPEAQAVEGALHLNTLVVCPAGNDGAAGPAFGSVSGPGGAPAALAVGALDSRTDVQGVRVVLRRGLDVLLDRRLPLLGPVAPTGPLTLQVATPRATAAVPGSQVDDYFERDGTDRAAGRAVVLRADGDPQALAAAASEAGAAAVLLYGADVPAGALPLSETVRIPVVGIPTGAAEAILAGRRAGVDVGVAIGSGRSAANGGLRLVAAFSSRGLAFDSGLKPNLVAPGVGIATSEPGTAADGTPRWGTVSGTSVAAATVAGTAALLVEMRPALTGASLESLLSGYARPVTAAAEATGAGELQPGAAAVGEVVAQPATLGFGVWGGRHWHATRTIVVRNVSSRRLQLSVVAAADSDPEALRFLVRPNRLVLRVGRARRIKVSVLAPAAVADRAVTGTIRIAAAGSQVLRVPWALIFHTGTGTLLPRVSISRSSFRPSDTDPAILRVQAGSVRDRGGLQVRPVARLDVLLYDASGRFIGVMAHLRDLLPGSYSFGITGRGPTSARLHPGSYELRIAAWPTLPKSAQPSRAKVRFRLE